MDFDQAIDHLRQFVGLPVSIITYGKTQVPPATLVFHRLTLRGGERTELFVDWSEPGQPEGRWADDDVYELSFSFDGLPVSHLYLFRSHFVGAFTYAHGDGIRIQTAQMELNIKREFG